MDGRPDAQVRAKTAEYLSLVGLEGYGDRDPAQLSGGQQQRVALARALIKEPAVLLLDEPLGALDLKLRKQMQLELTRIHRQVRTTFVFVTHDQEEALSLATRIAVMNGGRVVQEGAPREIYYQPADPFVADFIGESNLLAGTVDRAGAVPELALPDGQRLPVPVDTPDGPLTLMVRPEAVSVERRAAPGRLGRAARGPARPAAGRRVPGRLYPRHRGGGGRARRGGAAQPASIPCLITGAARGTGGVRLVVAR